MNWINLETKTLRSPEYVGSDPVQRATWLSLLCYCCEQENDGRIPNCREWKDRRWQQTCGVTKEEAETACDLWHWDGDDLVVAIYPHDKQAEVQAKREGGRTGGSATTAAKAAAARANGSKGGRPPETQAEPKEETQAGNPSLTQAEPKLKPNGKEGKGKGKEEKGREEGASAPPCTLNQAESFAPMARMTPDQARHWWHTRNAAGWTRGTQGGGAARRITSWQSDMASSVTWVQESMAKVKVNGVSRNFTSSDVGI